MTKLDLELADGIEIGGSKSSYFYINSTIESALLISVFDICFGFPIFFHH